MKKFKTRTTTQEDIIEKWFHIDASGRRLGRVASIAAELLLDKGNPKMREYLTPKSKVVITNAEKIDIPAKKLLGKLHTRYSGYPGGLKVETLGEVMEKYPERALERAIKRMLPKNRRGRRIYGENLYVYVGDEHKHQAQKPQIVDLNSIKL